MAHDKSRLTLLLLSVAQMVGVGAGCSTPSHAPVAFEEARERMVAAGREARAQEDPEKMVDGETARMAIERNRARGERKAGKADLTGLLDRLRSSGD